MIFSTFIFSHSLRLTLSLVAGWLLLPFTMLTCSLRLSMLDARATTLTSYMVAPSAPATWYVIIDKVSNSTRIFLYATAVFNLEKSEGRNSLSSFSTIFSLHSTFVCSCAGWHKKLCYMVRRSRYDSLFLSCLQCFSIPRGVERGVSERLLAHRPCERWEKWVA